MKKITTYILISIGLIMGKSYLNQSLAANITRPNISFAAGLAVNSFTGNLFYYRSEIKLPGSGPQIEVTFSYNSMNGIKDNGFGKGWAFSQNLHYYPDSTGVFLAEGNGNRHLFTENNGQYFAPPGVFDKLENYGQGLWKLKKPSGLTYFFEDSIHRQVTRIQDVMGNEVLFSYQNERLVEMVNSVGRSLRFSWSNGHLSSIEEGGGMSPRKITFFYNQDGFLIRTENPDNQSETYAYNLEGKLISISLIDGSQLFIGYTQGYIVSEIASCEYHDYYIFQPETHKTFHIKETEEGSLVDTYEFDSDGNLIRKKGSCCGYDMKYEYDQDLNIIQKIDAEGNIYSYTFDALGNKTSETDPLGYTAYYSYVPGTDWLTQFQDKAGFITNYLLDSAGNVIEVVDPLSQSEFFTYDQKGNLISHTDKKGITYHFGFDSLSNLTKISGPLGVEMTMVYNERGNIIEEIDPLGNKTIAQYDNLDRLISQTNALGHTTQWRYDEGGRVSHVIDPLGDSISFDYDALGRLQRERFPGNVSFAFKYNKRGNRIEARNPRGHSWRYRYNKRNQRVAEIDPLGNTTRFIYDSGGRLSSQIDALGNFSSFIYDAMGNIISETNAMGESFRFTYDALGRRTSIIDPLGNTRHLSYDALGRLSDEIDELGNRTRYRYDAEGAIREVIDPLGRRIQYFYDSLDRKVMKIGVGGDTSRFRYDLNGKLICRIEAGGDSLTFEYDALGQRIREQDQNGLSRSYVYDARGRLVQMQSVEKNTLHYTYDQLDRLIEIHDTLGLVERRSYDVVGNMLSKEDAVGSMYSYRYDALNRLIEKIDPNGKKMRYVFDALGRLAEMQNRKGGISKFEYDPLGRKISETNELGHITRYGYEARGRLAEVTDHLGRTTRYSFDGAGRKIAEIYPDNTQRYFAYNTIGQMTSLTNRNGQKITYEYDARGALAKKKYPGNREDIFVFDKGGRLISATNPWSHITFDYDAAGRRISETNRGKTTQYVYSQDLITQKMIYPGGREIESTYDIRDRLISITDGTRSLVDYSYRSDDLLATMTLGNGLQTSMNYDSLGSVTTIQHDTLLELSYMYDEKGYIITENHTTQSDKSRSFSYDAAGRLIAALRGPLQQGIINTPVESFQYAWDAVGNRTSTQKGGQTTLYQSNAKNAYTQVGSQVLSTDMEGNLLNDGNFQYVYDSENRLNEVKQSGNSRVLYLYDALGRRSLKITPNDTIYYYYSYDHIIEERDRKDSVIASYVYGRGVDDLVFAEIKGQGYYYHKDYQGNIRALSDSQGNPVVYYEYDPFGTRKMYNALWQSITLPSVENPYGYNGRRHETESGLIYYRSRSYHPELGRFIQPDPAGYIDGPHLYAYVQNSPINFTDPFGLSRGLIPRGWSVAKRVSSLLSPRSEFSFNLLSVTLLVIPIGPTYLRIDFGIAGAGRFCCDPIKNTINIQAELALNLEGKWVLGYGRSFNNDKTEADQAQNQRGESSDQTQKRLKREKERSRRERAAAQNKFWDDNQEAYDKEVAAKRKELQEAGYSLKGVKAKGEINKFKQELTEKYNKAFEKGFTAENVKKRVAEDFKASWNAKASIVNDIPTCPSSKLSYSGSYSLEIKAIGGVWVGGEAYLKKTLFAEDTPPDDEWDASIGWVNYVGLEISVALQGKLTGTGTIEANIPPDKLWR